MQQSIDHRYKTPEPFTQGQLLDLYRQWVAAMLDKKKMELANVDLEMVVISDWMMRIEETFDHGIL